MARRLGSAAILLVLATSAHTQFFDFFQGFQSFATDQPTYGSIYDVTRRDQGKNYHRQTTKQEETTKSYEIDRSNPFLPQFGGERDQNEYRRRKTTTTTTVKPRKKATTRRLVNNDKKTNNQDYNNNNKGEYDGKINAIGDYYTQKPMGNNRQEYNNNNSNDKSNYGNNRVDYNNYYSTQKPNYGSNNRLDYSNNYSTENPFNKGVKPVVTNGPPITNRPVTRRPTYGVDPRPKDDDAIAFPDDDASPEVIIGPDEDYMSTVEKKRYIELAERKCDEYKALGSKAVQAIPLLPSPEPVEINVPRCTPTTIPLVVGGKVVSIQEFPHMALLGWKNLQGGGYSWKCGGTLVSEQFILTAAHCSFQDRDNNVDNGPPTAVQLGSSYLDDPGALVVKVAAVIRHPKYKLPRSYYDLALVKLAHAVKFSEVIKPACLGTVPAVGKSIIATGWGRTQYGGGQSHELRSVSLPVWEMSRCQEVLGTSRKLPDGPSSDSQLCAGEERGGKDTCQGDSGGPAQIQEDCIWRVVGVTSLGRSCGAAETPGLYAKLQRAFIASQVFGSQNLKNYTSNNAESGYNNANSGHNNGYYNNNNGNSWNSNGGNNRQDGVYTERPKNIDNNNRRQQGSNRDYNTQRPNGSGNYNAGQAYGENNREQDDYNINMPHNQQIYNNNNQPSINNRPTRYTTTLKPNRSDGLVFNYNNDDKNDQQNNQNVYTTRKPVKHNNNYDNANSQNYENNNRGNSDHNKTNNVGYNSYNSQNYDSSNRDQSNYNNQATQRTQSDYGGTRQSNYENYTINKPWWLT